MSKSNQYADQQKWSQRCRDKAYGSKRSRDEFIGSTVRPIVQVFLDSPPDSLFPNVGMLRNAEAVPMHSAPGARNPNTAKLALLSVLDRCRPWTGPEFVGHADEGDKTNSFMCLQLKVTNAGETGRIVQVSMRRRELPHYVLQEDAVHPDIHIVEETHMQSYANGLVRWAQKKAVRTWEAPWFVATRHLGDFRFSERDHKTLIFKPGKSAFVDKQFIRSVNLSSYDGKAPDQLNARHSDVLQRLELAAMEALVGNTCLIAYMVGTELVVREKAEEGGANQNLRIFPHQNVITSCARQTGKTWVAAQMSMGKNTYHQIQGLINAALANPMMISPKGKP
jgi:hypothetical protein